MRILKNYPNISIKYPENLTQILTDNNFLFGKNDINGKFNDFFPFPRDKANTTEHLNFTSLDFTLTPNIHDTQAEKEMNSQKFRPATLAETLLFINTISHTEKVFMCIVIGKVWINGFGFRVGQQITVNEEEKILNLYSVDTTSNGWAFYPIIAISI